MAETTLEEARRCPKCDQPGTFSHELAVPRGPDITRGAKLHHYKCENERCRWNGQICRIVQVNPDGTIPPATQRTVKHFPNRPDLTAAINRQVAEQVAMETSETGGEVGRR